LLEDIPIYPYHAEKFKLKKDIPFDEKINNNIITAMKEVFENLGKDIKQINQLDGCRLDYDGGWILIRRSGTSPYLRISGESNKDLETTITLNNLAKEKMLALNLIQS
jgi:phosphomannomutase